MLCSITTLGCTYLLGPVSSAPRDLLGISEDIILMEIIPTSTPPLLSLVPLRVCVGRTTLVGARVVLGTLRVLVHRGPGVPGSFTIYLRARA